MKGVKVDLSRIRSICPDQLTPFNGLWGFSSDVEFYHGTIFRFPLRTGIEASKLRADLDPLDCVGSPAVHRHMEKFWDEARIYLLFLKNIRLVDFRVRGEEEVRWSVKSAQDVSGSRHVSGWTTCTLTRHDGDTSATVEDHWWTEFQDLGGSPIRFPNHPGLAAKHRECAMAGLVRCVSLPVCASPPSRGVRGENDLNQESDMKQAEIGCCLTLLPAPIRFPRPDRLHLRRRKRGLGQIRRGTADKNISVPEPTFFNALPLRIPTHLPVHIHASFEITGDREMLDEHNEENHWLLTTAIPSLYLTFLENLGREIGQDVFGLWPQKAPAEIPREKLIYESFWKKICLKQKSPARLPQLFPVAKKEHQKPGLLDIGQATFNFLPTDQSSILANVLSHLDPTIVHVPSSVQSQMQSLDLKISSVNGQMLRKILQSEDACRYIERLATTAPKVLDTLLEVIKPIKEEEFSELDGCRILPLADGSLGKLQIMPIEKEPANRSLGKLLIIKSLVKGRSSTLYYLSDATEAKIFEFASDILALDEKPGHSFKNALIHHKRFNLKRLSLSDIVGLLDRKPFNAGKFTPDMNAWLQDFWKLWRLKQSKGDTTSPTGLQNYPVYEATRSGVRMYLKPCEFDKLPAVVEPSNEKHWNLCQRIPGIYTINRNFIPATLSTAESSLDNPASFIRLIKAISELGSTGESTVDVFIRSHLCPDDLNDFRELVTKFISSGLEFQRGDVQPLLKSLPLFPVADPSNPWISAANALATTSYCHLPPWMKGYSRFMDPTFLNSKEYGVLKALNITIVAYHDLLIQYILPALPQRLDARTWRGFTTLIHEIAEIKNMQSCLSNLRQSKLAPDGNLVLQFTSTLYDHEDPVFDAAFRYQSKERFLLKDVRQDRDFWLGIGLAQRINGYYAAKDYVLCLSVMGERQKNPDSDILSDTRTILDPLISTTHAVSNFQTSDWSDVAREAIFPVEVILDDQPKYRRETMNLVASSMPLLPLSEAIKDHHIPVCWSQVSFPMYQPSPLTFERLPARGNPSSLMVWRHLVHLSKLAAGLPADAISDFLSDLHRTYTYLQENIEESSESFTFQEHQIWLNLEITEPAQVSLEDLRSSWLPAKHLLLLSSCDSPPLMSVRQLLLPYERLLRKIGCKPINHVNLNVPGTQQAESLCKSLSRLRQEGMLLDVTLKAEGKEIKAHKVVLATCSGYFKRHFNGSWKDEDIILKEIEENCTKPFATLSTIIDFAYTDTFNWGPMRLLENEVKDTNIIDKKLDSILDLCTGADYLDMPSLAAQAQNEILIGFQTFVAPDNVLDVRYRASKSNARELERACILFYERNKEVVDLAYEYRGTENGEFSGITVPGPGITVPDPGRVTKPSRTRTKLCQALSSCLKLSL